MNESTKIETLTYAQARQRLKKAGTAHAEGDALRTMYATLCEDTHGISADAVYEALPLDADGPRGFVETARAWLRDRMACYMGVIEGRK